ncbi:MAG TPA: Bax inhibitor-1 family protein [Acidimicrobiales bacterium]|nr:Bax inhibitor-1 family protein [Acidimicrobiales bacterium]
MALSYVPVAQRDEATRSDFIVKVYQHLLLAVAAFVGIEALLFRLGVAKGIYDFISQGGVAWLLLLGGFMIGSWLATNAAHDLGDTQRQYMGLFGLAALEALIFAPFLYLFFEVVDGSSTVWAAAVITGIGFAGLSAVAYTTRKDLSFLRPLVMWGMVGGLVLIVAAVLFGLNLGVWFSVGMIVLAGTSILYKTQQIIRHFPAEAYVGASVQLFASLMLLFWYVLRLLGQVRR